MSALHLIWNPIAGSGAAKVVFDHLRNRLTELGIDFSESMSAYPGHALILAKEAATAGHKTVLALGGDGTVREVATGLYGSSVPLAVIPCGTGNDLARALHIPRDPDAALDIALNGIARPMDAAEANGELFFNIAGFGFDVDVVIATELYKKTTRSGSMAYVKGVLHALREMSLRKTHLSWIDENDVRHEADYNILLLAAANGTHFGGGMNVTPLADPFDGLFDICVLHDFNKPAFLTRLLPFIKGKHLRFRRYISYFRAKELTASCDPLSRIQADGELLKETPCTFRLLPGAIRVMTPQPSRK